LAAIAVALVTLVGDPEMAAAARSAPQQANPVANQRNVLPLQQPPADAVTRLYWATLNRAPDTSGYRYWASAHARGVPLAVIAESFLSSAEWQTRMGALSNSQFVDLLYRNVLGRSPDTTGRQYWTWRADTGLDRTQMVLLFSESDEFARKVAAKTASNRSASLSNGSSNGFTLSGARCRPLARSAFDMFVDPADASTWGPSRSEGQLVAYDRFNAGETRGNFVNQIGLPNLTFNGANEVHGPRLPNGETWRVKADVLPGAGPSGADVEVLRGRYWFDPDRAGYRTPSQVGDPHGRVSHGRSDPLFFDGNRFDYGYLEADNLVTVGPGADTFLWSTTFQVKDWMWATDPTTFGFEIHTPVGVPGSAPVRGSVARGRFDVVGRYSASPISPSGNTNPQTTGQTLGSWSLPPVGSFVSMVWHGRIDPGASGFLDVWVSVDGGAATQVVDVGNNWGFVFDARAPRRGWAPSGAVGNRGFYLMSKMYDFHEWPKESQPNWDDTYGTIREGTYVGWGGALNPTESPQRFMEHQNAFLGAAC
jgi:hypothetical protein